MGLFYHSDAPSPRQPVFQGGDDDFLTPILLRVGADLGDSR